MCEAHTQGKDLFPCRRGGKEGGGEEGEESGCNTCMDVGKVDEVVETARELKHGKSLALTGCHLKLFFLTHSFAGASGHAVFLKELFLLENCFSFSIDTLRADNTKKQLLLEQK